MAKPGYQAVGLDPPVARALRDVAHYLSVVSAKRVTLSDALAQLIQSWLHTQQLDPPAAAFVGQHLAEYRDQLAAKGGG